MNKDILFVIMKQFEKILVRLLVVFVLAGTFCARADLRSEGLKSASRMLVVVVGPDWNPASPKVRTTFASSSFRQNFPKTLFGEYVHNEATKPDAATQKGNAWVKSLVPAIYRYPTILIFDAKGRSQGLVENIPADLNGAELARRVKAQIASVEAIVAKLPTAPGESLAALQPLVPGLVFVDRRKKRQVNWYGDAWQNLLKLDPEDKQGWQLRLFMGNGKLHAFFIPAGVFGRFTARVGLQTELAKGGACAFIVSANGKELACVEHKAGEEAGTVDVALPPEASEITLRVASRPKLADPAKCYGIFAEPTLWPRAGGPVEVSRIRRLLADRAAGIEIDPKAIAGFNFNRWTKRLAQKQDEIAATRGEVDLVFVGDSITHGGRYHAYIADYYLTRFPSRNIRFVNSGIAGDTAAGAFQRIPEDVAEYAPTHVAFHFGMNDIDRSAYLPVSTSESLVARERAQVAYRANMCKLIEGVRKAAPDATFIYLTPTPYEDRAVITNAPTSGWASVNQVGCNVGLSLMAGFVIASASAAKAKPSAT